jgi:chlorite dismutase
MSDMTEQARPAAAHETSAAAPPAPTYLDFIFYKVENEFRRRPEEERQRAALEFRDLLAHWGKSHDLRSYTCVGLRPECDFLLWLNSKEFEPQTRLATAILGTRLGGYLKNTHTFLGMTKHTPYFKRERPQNFELGASSLKYLFVYPFTKTHAWYQLPFEERQKMMGEHRTVATQFSKVLTNTVYNFGFGDYDFLLAFETDDPKEWNDCVQKLREVKARVYTQVDVPIIPCMNVTYHELIESLAL